MSEPDPSIKTINKSILADMNQYETHTALIDSIQCSNINKSNFSQVKSFAFDTRRFFIRFINSASLYAVLTYTIILNCLQWMDTELVLIPAMCP